MKVMNIVPAVAATIAMTVGTATAVSAAHNTDSTNNVGTNVSIQRSGQDPKHGTVDVPFWVYKPCKEEDSVNCRWIATGPHHRGNGKGHTFIVRELPGSAHMVCVFYANRKYARHNDYCEATK